MQEKNTIDNYNKTFIGINLKNLRTSYKLTKEDVAKIIGKSMSGYDKYENGVRDISINDLIKLSGFYNVSLDVICANPFSHRSETVLSFLGFKNEEGEAISTRPYKISTIYDDVIVYEEDELTYLFFWKTNVNNDGHVMLFHYYDKAYVSKIFYNGKGGGHFYINGKPRYFNKAHAENILMRGVLMGKLKKEFVIDNFFTPNF